MMHLNASQPTKVPYHTLFSRDPYSNGLGELLTFQLHSEMHCGLFTEAPASALDLKPSPFPATLHPLLADCPVYWWKHTSKMTLVILVGKWNKL